MISAEDGDKRSMDLLGEVSLYFYYIASGMQNQGLSKPNAQKCNDD